MSAFKIFLYLFFMHPVSDIPIKLPRNCDTKTSKEFEDIFLTGDYLYERSGRFRINQKIILILHLVLKKTLSLLNVFWLINMLNFDCCLSQTN
jgi:hypothetical protein